MCGGGLGEEAYGEVCCVVLRPVSSCLFIKSAQSMLLSSDLTFIELCCAVLCCVRPVLLSLF